MAGPGLTGALDELWQAAARLPDDDEAFDALDPKQRREAHDLGCRIQDRLVRALATLAAGMAADGADLVDGRGLPDLFEAEHETSIPDRG